MNKDIINETLKPYEKASAEAFESYRLAKAFSKSKKEVAQLKSEWDKALDIEIAVATSLQIVIGKLERVEA
jgi:hypothetical protein